MTKSIKSPFLRFGRIDPELDKKLDKVVEKLYQTGAWKKKDQKKP